MNTISIVHQSGGGHTRALAEAVARESVSDDEWKQGAIEREGPHNPLQIEHLSKLWLALRVANERGARFDPQMTSALQYLKGSAPTTFAEFVQQNLAAFSGERFSSGSNDPSDIARTL